jgi:xanthine dehydrogenase accessory factor
VRRAGSGVIPVLVAPDLDTLLPALPRPLSVLVDARLAKHNEDTRRDHAPFVVGLGPGFSAGDDVHAVVETKRGHRLGRVIWNGPAQANTGTPGFVAGKGRERVLRAPVAGVAAWRLQIGDLVQPDETIGWVDGRPVQAPFAGVIRGLIAPGTTVRAGLKIGDVDPRGDPEACTLISDKALAVGGGVLAAILVHLNRQE